MSPMQARLSRGFPPSGVRPSEHQQAKRVAAAAAAGTSSSSPRSGCITSKEQVGTSFSEGEAPPSSAPAAAAAAAAAQQACRAAATEKEDAGSVSGMSISAEEGGEAEQEDGPPALESLGSAPAPPTASSKGALKAQQQKEHGKRKPVDINDMMHKARKAADNIRLLLHAKVSMNSQSRRKIMYRTGGTLAKKCGIGVWWAGGGLTGSLCRFNHCMFFPRKRGRDDVILPGPFSGRSQLSPLRGSASSATRRQKISRSLFALWVLRSLGFST